MISLILKLIFFITRASENHRFNPIYIWDTLVKIILLSHFPHNLFLIMAQKPEATHITGFRTCNNLNSQVKKREKAIRIFTPVFLKKKKQNDDGSEDIDALKENDPILYYRTVSVFDVSQTKDDPLPEPTQVYGDASELIPLIEQTINISGIEIEYDDTCTTYGKSCKGKIIKSGMNSTETFNTLIHEFANELLHQTSKPKESKTIR